MNANNFHRDASKTDGFHPKCIVCRKKMRTRGCKDYLVNHPWRRRFKAAA